MFFFLPGGWTSAKRPANSLSAGTYCAETNPQNITNHICQVHTDRHRNLAEELGGRRQLHLPVLPSLQNLAWHRGWRLGLAGPRETVHTTTITCQY